MLELVKGRPIQIEGREEKEIETYNFLDELQVEYERVDHEAAYSMEACEKIDKVLGGKTCKNLFLCNRQKTEFYLLLMPGEKPFKTKELSKQIGSARLSFGTKEDMLELLNLTPGSVTVLGLRYDTDNRVKLLIDKEVMEAPFFGCHPCVNTASIKIKGQDVFEKIIPALKHEYQLVTLSGEESV